MNKIESGYFEGSQSYEYHALYAHGKFTLKLEIDKDSYDFQSSARTEMLTPDGWKLLYYIPYPEMEAVIHDCSKYNKPECELYMKKDEERLIGMSTILLQSL